MSHQKVSGFSLTDKGRDVAFDALSRYEAGESVEVIADSHDLNVGHVQLLLALAYATGEMD